MFRFFEKHTPKLFALMGLFALSACSITGFAPEVDHASKTSSIITYDNDVDLQETVDPSDWDKVREVMASVLASQPAGEPVEWENDVTGTIGTIVPMALTSNENGSVCRQFSTTLNGIGGVQQYQGDACQSKGGIIELTGLKPHNAVVEIAPSSEKQVQ